MSKMKHLLKKLHIGGGLNEHHRLAGPTQPVMAAASPSPSPSPSRSQDSSSSASGLMGTIGPVETAERDRTAVEGVNLDFNLMEEEFQVQLAMAISASDPDAREDPERAQIDVAKRISLGCSASLAGADTLVDFLSLRYWGHKVINYNEKVKDGFYDVYGIASNSIGHGKLPLLVDLQTISISDTVDYEVILVNRLVDAELQDLERKAYAASRECPDFGHGLVSSGLIQKIADIVVEKMGGKVKNADEMVRKWTSRSYELRNLLNSIILPLGHLDVGLARHRALLFKVLADRVDLPCMLVKGSYYTGTDDGAVNLIKLENGSEYIIDLMGAPGSLIPTEVPSNYLPISGPDTRGFPDPLDTLQSPSLVPGKGIVATSAPVPTNNFLDRRTLTSGDQFYVEAHSNHDEKGSSGKIRTGRFEHDFGELMQLQHKPECSITSIRSVTGNEWAESSWLKYASASHARKLGTLYGSLQYNSDNTLLSYGCSQVSARVKSLTNNAYENKHKWMAAGLAGECKRSEPCMTVFDGETSSPTVDLLCTEVENKLSETGENMNKIGEEFTVEMMETDTGSQQVACVGNDEKVDRMLGEAAKWEIPWEDLRIGERIGIGSYGEVYRADWNGTEVAVKKFLDQDFSGDALAQFRSEVGIMLRLRHPNVVLFMGAVTRSPHFSILIEFLPRGSLYRLLHRPNQQLDEKRRMRMALDVAKGMNYLHTSHPTIVHRDLKSPNLLVDKNWVVKVCDFGLSRLKHHTFLSSKSTAGTPEWMAPEVLRNEPANEKCDVYSFGVILWELATLRIPWKGLNPMQVVGAVGFQNRRLDIPEYVDPSIAQIICECWQTEPRLRPSFSEIMHRLRRLQRLNVDRTDPTDKSLE